MGCNLINFAYKQLTCNCSKVNLPCILNGNCRLISAIYKILLPCGEDYKGSTSRYVKERLFEHRTNIKTVIEGKKKIKRYSLTSHIAGCNKCKEGIGKNMFEVEIMQIVKLKNSGTFNCSLCNAERLALMKSRNSVNSRDELLSCCMHNERIPANLPVLKMTKYTE